MKLHGRAKIELFDLDGNKVYEQSKDNIITNLYTNMLRPNFRLDLETVPQNRASLASMTPLYDKLFGGIVLLGSNKEANANNVLFTSDDYENFIGNAGSPYVGTSKYRGSHNDVESGEFEDEHGVKFYRHVFDFASNQANGTISTICLVPKMLGDGGLVKDSTAGDTGTSLIYGYGKDEANINNKTGRDRHAFADSIITNSGYLKRPTASYSNWYLKPIEGGVQLMSAICMPYLKVNTTIVESLGERPVTNNDIYQVSELRPLVDTEYGYTNNNIDAWCFYSGSFWNCTLTGSWVNGQDISVKVARLDEATGDVVTRWDRTIHCTKDLSGNYFYSFVNGKIYITFQNHPDLIIFDPDLSIVNSVELPFNNSKAVKFHSMVMCVRRTNMDGGLNPVAIITNNLNVLYNEIVVSNRITNTPLLNNIYGGSSIYNDPIGILTLEDDEIERNLTIVLPGASSINNVATFTKYPTNTLKITYDLYTTDE